MMQKIGVIGAGNMGSAVVRAIQRSELRIQPDSLWVSRKKWHDGAEASFEGCHTTTDNRQLAACCDTIILAIKPQQAESVLMEIKDSLQDQLIISIMAGWGFERLAAHLPEATRFIMAMPNTPMAVGEGMILLSDRSRCNDSDMQMATRLFEGGGKVAVVDDAYFIAANIVSGCGPAYAYMFIEALADGAVQHGVPRKLAYELASQMLIGAGRMVLEKGDQPGTLKDAVCSPNGTTIAGVHALESGAFRGTVMDAVSASYHRHIELSK